MSKQINVGDRVYNCDPMVRRRGEVVEVGADGRYFIQYDGRPEPTWVFPEYIDKADELRIKPQD